MTTSVNPAKLDTKELPQSKDNPAQDESVKKTTDNPLAPSTPLIKKSKMSATWHTKPREEWSFFERTLVDLNILQDPHDSERPPVHPKEAPVPYFPIYEQWKWILPRATAPLLINWGYSIVTGKNVPNYVAGPLYLACFLMYGTSLFNSLRRMGKAYGFFDGAKQRDGIPDGETMNVVLELMGVISVRTFFAFALVYPKVTDQSQMLNLEWLMYLPFRLAINACTIDFYFYWYHRLMHENDTLWGFHKHHHETRHPNAALGAFADHTQEIFDMLVIPALAYITFPIDFPTWWMSCCATLYIEASGHSGIREYA